MARTFVELNDPRTPGNEALRTGIFFEAAFWAVVAVATVLAAFAGVVIVVGFLVLTVSFDFDEVV